MILKTKIWLTKCIVHSGLVVNLGFVALIGLRQICRFDYFFNGGKFGSLRNLNIIALKSATQPYISRCGAWVKCIRLHLPFE